MTLTLAYLVVLVICCRWWHEWGVAKGRLLERVEARNQCASMESRGDRRLHVVRGDDGPGTA